MTTLRIYDSSDGHLAFDLRHLIDLFAPRSLEANWTVSPVRLISPELGPIDEFMMTGKGEPGEDLLEQFAANGSSVSGTALSQAAHKAWQVIWGQFTATTSEQSDTWIVIRAIDSTFYEVTSSDEAVLYAVRSTYRDVRAAPGPVSSIPIEPI
jgi:hypothetical protein